MSPSGDSSILVTAIAAIVTLIGYLINQWTNRRAVKQKLYADALAAVREYEELPFQIARRAGSSNSVRSAIGDVEAKIFVKLGLYRSWLQIEDREVGTAYTVLLNKTHQSCAPNRRRAWSNPLISDDQEAYLDRAFTFGNKDEWALCMQIMKRHLSPASVFYRRGSRTLITEISGVKFARKQYVIDPKTPEFGEST